MSIWMTGINHKTSSVGIREKFYLGETEQRLLLNGLKNDPAVIEAIVLSTCNRTEIYANLITESPDSLLKQLFRIKNLPQTSEALSYFYSYSQEEAVRQFFRVSTGLDSIILGEKQILGQVKNAIEVSRQEGMLNKEFNLLSRLAIRAGKLAQSSTQIGNGGSSVCWAAVKMAESLLGNLGGKNILIIGAGKMGDLTVKQFQDKNIGQFFIINRTQEKAEILAQQVGATAVSFGDIKDVLEIVDICICCSGCPHYLIEKSFVEKIMLSRAQRPLICIDISVPRNIEPAVQEIPGVNLISIDDLDKVVGENLSVRQAAVSQVEEIIDIKIDEFYAKLSKNAYGVTENIPREMKYAAY